MLLWSYGRFIKWRLYPITTLDIPHYSVTRGVNFDHPKMFGYQNINPFTVKGEFD